ncbi:5-hydroxytryptamine receptor 4-like [Asterias rubens]|uniref:5-hydroxytryptamine receptor 4-like n=1 Tax=Asterias rubens TaxID=7604 RepID=UPI001455061B|nr:5-hydroxytryptamine receptor 4-like [Asterias rubens]
MYPQPNGTESGDALDDEGAGEFRFSDYNQRVVVASLNLLISVFGIFGNVLVILAVALSRRLRTITNAFVVSLSVADLLTCMSLPFNAANLLHSDLSNSMFSDLVCKTLALILYTCGGCSLYTLAAIALNRYILITKSIKHYRSLYTPFKVAVMVTATWFVPLLVAFVPPLFGLGELGYAEKYGTCNHKTSNPLSHIYSIFQAVSFYPGPMVIIVICYVKIFKHVKQHCQNMMTSSSLELSISSSVQTKEALHPKENNSVTRRLTSSRRQIDITKNLFCVVLAFVICVSPFGIALMIPPSDPFIPWAAVFLAFNSCVNPVIYATKHPQFRQVFRLMLRCQFNKIQPDPFVRKAVIRRR